jgi:hypothetical protein
MSSLPVEYGQGKGTSKVHAYPAEKSFCGVSGRIKTLTSGMWPTSPVTHHGGTLSSPNTTASPQASTWLSSAIIGKVT